MRLMGNVKKGGLEGGWLGRAVVGGDLASIEIGGAWVAC